MFCYYIVLFCWRWFWRDSFHYSPPTLFQSYPQTLPPPGTDRPKFQDHPACNAYIFSHRPEDSAEEPDWACSDNHKPDCDCRCKLRYAASSHAASSGGVRMWNSRWNSPPAWNFGRLVLGCIEASDSESRRIFQHFSRSTRFSPLRTALSPKNNKNLPKFLHIWQGTFAKFHSN